MLLSDYLKDERQAILGYELTDANDNIARRYQEFLESKRNPDDAAFIDAISCYGDTCLDLGCSYCAQYYALKKLYPRVIWTGCDIAQQFIDRCKIFHNQDLEIIKIDSYDKLPFADNSFDVVTSRSMISHYSFAHARPILNEMLRVAKNAVIIKLYQPPIGEKETYNPISGVNKAKGFICNWSKLDWEAFRIDKTVKEFLVNNVFVIKK